MFVFAGDRFVLRDSAGQNTLAGGVVLDPDAEPKIVPERSAAELSPPTCRIAQRGDVICRLTNRARPGSQAVAIAVEVEFQRCRHFQCSFAASGEGKVVLAADFAVDAGNMASCCASVQRMQLTRTIARTPNSSGLSLSDLRTNLEADLPFSELFEFLVSRFMQE